MADAFVADFADVNRIREQRVKCSPRVMRVRLTLTALGRSSLGKDAVALQILFKQSNAAKLLVAPENIPDGLRLSFVDHDSTLADVIP
jgi:hypothetical protein